MLARGHIDGGEVGQALELRRGVVAQKGQYRHYPGGCHQDLQLSLAGHLRMSHRVLCNGDAAVSSVAMRWSCSSIKCIACNLRGLHVFWEGLRHILGKGVGLLARQIRR